MASSYRGDSRTRKEGAREERYAQRASGRRETEIKRAGRENLWRERDAYNGASTRPQRASGRDAIRYPGAVKDQARPPRRAIYKKEVPPAVRDETAPAFAAPVEEQTSAPENLLAGRNPIREAIRSGRAIDKLMVQKGELSGSAREIVAKAREARIVVQYVDRARLDAIYPGHQGMVACVAAASYSTVEDMLDLAKERGEEPFLIALDGITDPHNLGAIIRTAECAGAHGVILPERRSATLNPAAVKASAGAVEYQRVARVVNLARTLNELKGRGLWVVGADMSGGRAKAADLSGPIVLVVGSEGEGISQLVAKNCDRTVSLPVRGKIDSLNASVAAGVLMYEVMKARGW